MEKGRMMLPLVGQLQRLKLRTKAKQIPHETTFLDKLFLALFFLKTKKHWKQTFSLRLCRHYNMKTFFEPRLEFVLEEGIRVREREIKKSPTGVKIGKCLSENETSIHAG